MTNISAAAAANREQARETNGQFGIQAHTPPAVFTDPGSAPVAVGNRTPWGEAQHVELVAPGIAYVDTESHGGIKLAADRNAAVPAPLRARNGWYEEDCAAHIVRWTFPAEFARLANAEEIAEYENERVRYWYPDQWEQATGRQVQPGQSRIRDDERFAQAHAHEFVETFVSSPDVAEFPELDGMVLVTAERGADGRRETFVVPRREHRQTDRLVIDPDRHEPWTVADTPPDLSARAASAAADVLPDARHTDLTDRQRATYEKETETTRYRLADGEVVSFAEMIDRSGGVVGKTVYRDERGKANHYLQHPDGSLQPVTFATWKAATTADLRTPYDHAVEERLLAEAELARAQSSGDFAARKRARDRVANANARVALWNRERIAQDDARNARIGQTGPNPTRATLAADLTDTQAEIAARGGWWAAPQHLQDRYERFRRYGTTHQLFRENSGAA